MFEQYQTNNALEPDTGVLTFGLWTLLAISNTERGAHSHETKGRMGASSTSASETILNAGRRDSASHSCEGVEEQQLEPETAPEGSDPVIASVHQELITDEVNSKSKTRKGLSQNLLKALLSNAS